MRVSLQTTKPTDDDGCIHREPGATGEREAKRGRPVRVGNPLGRAGC